MSLLAWFFPWLVVGAVVAGSVWFAVRAVGDDGSAPQVVTPATSPSETDPAIENTPTPTPEVSVEPTPEVTPVSFDGVTVQVLNATGGVEGAAQRMAVRLEEFGFVIVATDTALVEYDLTTIYWTSPESKPIAKALAEQEGWAAERRPESLSATVQIHILVGKDEAT